MTDMIEVESSNIAAVGYEDDTSTLVVRFNSGSEYRYYGVAKEVFDELLNAPSKGRYFNQNIRGIYDYGQS